MDKFNLIDLNKWERAEHYLHFMNDVPCSYAITANIDVTRLHSYAKEKELKFYPLIIIATTLIVNELKAFRFSLNEKNQLGYFDICHPSYTINNAVEGSFSGIWTQCFANNKEFYENIANDINEFSKATSYAPKPNQPYNTFYISSTPEISFTSLNMTLFQGAKNLTPLITFGKYFEQGEKLLIPLALNLHHAVCDGYHAGQFYKAFQNIVDSLEI